MTMKEESGLAFHADAKAERAALALLKARIESIPISELSPSIRPNCLNEAYRVQESLAALLEDSGFGAPAGYKIGCTTDVMQRYLGITQPCAGQIFTTTIGRRSGRYRRNRLCRPGVECEIGVKIGLDMTDDRPFSPENCAAYVAEVMASIELVDDRWTDFRKVSTPSLIGDHFFGAGCVFGDGDVLEPHEIAALKGRMWINGDFVGEGAARDILGDPLEALAWLANHCQQMGHPLAEGHLVSLGSVVPTQWIEAGDTVRIAFDGLPHCSLELV